MVELYDLITNKSGKSLGIVLEYLPGTDLSVFAPTSSSELLRVLYQIASGLADIHAAGQIHRDIKPQNMKFDAESIVKLFDFGISRDVAASKTNALRGTRAFKAPEFYNTAPVVLTPAADTYAFGVSVWRFCSRRPPPELMAMPPTPPPPIGSVTNLIPPAICALIDQTLHPRASERPAMSVLRDEIGKHILFNEHRAFFSFEGQSFFLDKNRKSVKVGAGSIGSLRIVYTGHEFTVQDVVGEVFVNGNVAVSGNVLPGSCVIILGKPERKGSRRFVTFDLSHPELII